MISSSIDFSIYAVRKGSIRWLKSMGLEDLRKDMDWVDEHFPPSRRKKIVVDSIRSFTEHCDPDAFHPLVDLFEAILNTQDETWSDFCYRRYVRFAGEVEARNAALREFVDSLSVLARNSEDEKRKNQLIYYLYYHYPLTTDEWAESRNGWPVVDPAFCQIR